MCKGEVMKEIDIKLIADHYGYESQSRQLIEEMAELTQAINKEWRNTNECEITHLYKNLVEEIADVEIMLEQIKYLIGCNDDVEKIKNKKIDRTIAQINKKIN